MQLKNVIFLGFASWALADNDCDGSSDCSTTSVDGIVLTTRATTTDVGVSTSVRPVLTTLSQTTTDVGVATSRKTLSETTDVGTTPTATNTLFGTTTDVNLQSGYAYTTDSSGHTSAVYTGTGSAPPLTSSTASASSGSGTSSGNVVMVHGGLALGAVAIGAIAFVV